MSAHLSVKQRLAIEQKQKEAAEADARKLRKELQQAHEVREG